MREKLANIKNIQKLKQQQQNYLPSEKPAQSNAN